MRFVKKCSLSMILNRGNEQEKCVCIGSVNQNDGNPAKKKKIINDNLTDTNLKLSAITE